MEIQEKFIISLEKAKQHLKIADHMTYMTFPIVRENRLLLKILEEIYKSLLNTINSILQYEYTYKRIQIYRDAKENFRTFREISGKFNINSEQLKKIVEILNIGEKHKKSPFEFVRKDKIVIMTDNTRTETLTIDKIKEFLIETKDLLRKAEIGIKTN